MSSDYEKLLEDANEKLKEQLGREHEEIDKYKDYFDLLQKSKIIEFQRYGHDDIDCWGVVFPKKDPKQTIHLVIKTHDFHDFPMLHEKIDEFHKERMRMGEEKDKNEIKWERRKQIFMVSIVVIAAALLLWACGRCIWWAYIASI